MSTLAAEPAGPQRLDVGMALAARQPYADRIDPARETLGRVRADDPGHLRAGRHRGRAVYETIERRFITFTAPLARRVRHVGTRGARRQRLRRGATVRRHGPRRGARRSAVRANSVARLLHAARARRRSRCGRVRAACRASAALPFLVQAGHVALRRRLQIGMSARGGNSFELAPRIQDSAQVAPPTPGDLTTTRMMPMVQPAGVQPVEAPALESRAGSHTGC